MKRRHAAMLGLVGWYLMLPPGSDTSAPLWKWAIKKPYDTVKECEAARTEEIDRALGLPPEAAANPLLPNKARWLKSAKAARCIASDDPRLKEK